MTRTVLIYANMSGNTEMSAEAVAAGIRKAGGRLAWNPERLSLYIKGCGI